MHEAHDMSAPRRTHSRRRVLRGAALGGAGLLGLSALASVPGAAQGNGHDHRARPRHSEIVRDEMRRLWQEHIVWTRGFIVSFAASLPDLDATTARLLRNQVDIGEAIKSLVDAEAGDRMTALLTDHILGAAQLLSRAKAGDAAGVEQARAAWNANGDDIAALLVEINPRAWTLADMSAMMREHLDLTLEEAAAQLQGDWAGSIAAYDRVQAAMLHMADMLADGLDRRGPH